MIVHRNGRRAGRNFILWRPLFAPFCFYFIIIMIGSPQAGEYNHDAMTCKSVGTEQEEEGEGEEEEEASRQQLT